MKRKLLLSGIILLYLVETAIVNAQAPYYPDRDTWEYHSPAQHKIDSTALYAAIDFAIENEYTGSRDLRVAILEGFANEPYHKLAGPVKKRGGPAGLVIRDGYIIASWGDIQRVDMTFSVTKSFLSTVAGLAFDQGLIRSVHDRVIDYVWDGTFDGQHNSTITWDHLLNQSSDWSGTLFGMQDWADRPPDEGGLDDWKLRDLNTPGTKYEYNDVRVNVLAFALIQVWRKPLPVVLKEQIMDPIGASSSWRWSGYDDSWVTVDGLRVQSVSGRGHSGGGMFISTLDLARFGLLFLHHGQWNDRQLVSREWIDRSTSSSHANPAYGYMWWLNNGSSRWTFAPSETYYAAGFGGNYVIIDPVHNVVVVTRWLEPSKLDQFMAFVYQAL